jgi:hypothetical protein
MTDRAVARAMSRLWIRIADLRRREGKHEAADRALDLGVAWTLYCHGLGPELR